MSGWTFLLCDHIHRTAQLQNFKSERIEDKDLCWRWEFHFITVLHFICTWPWYQLDRRRRFVPKRGEFMAEEVSEYFSPLQAWDM